ncbi:MAG: hypothetical protein FWF84_04420 [Kiritimatiellaeota bacterium]|nr:hypothetical protein [Kiritimatiellota bacterium]
MSAATPASAALATSDRGQDPVAAAADAMAKRWLSRFDRERVAQALKAHYVANVAYPDTLAALEALPPEKRPPKTDRFGKPWAYAPGGMKRIMVSGNQTYTLTSTELGDRSNINDDFAKAYPSPALEFRRTGSNAVEVRDTDGASLGTLQEGIRINGYQLATVDEYGRFALVTDGDFWLTPLPAGGTR